MSTSVNDWHATKAAPLQNAFAGQGVTRGTLQNAQKVMNLPNGVDTTDSTQVSAVNAQTSKVQSQTLNTVNHDATLAAQTVAGTGDPGLHHGQNDFSLAVEVPPVSWTPKHLCFRSPLCQRNVPHIRPSSGGR